MALKSQGVLASHLCLLQCRFRDVCVASVGLTQSAYICVCVPFFPHPSYTLSSPCEPLSHVRHRRDPDEHKRCSFAPLLISLIFLPLPSLPAPLLCDGSSCCLFINFFLGSAHIPRCLSGAFVQSPRVRARAHARWSSVYPQTCFPFNAPLSLSLAFACYCLCLSI